MKVLESEMKQVRYHLKHLTDYAISWFEGLKQKYGKGRERNTELRTVDKLTASQVALPNVKIDVKRKDGVIGIGTRTDAWIGGCSGLSEIVVFRGDGRFLV